MYNYYWYYYSITISELQIPSNEQLLSLLKYSFHTIFVAFLFWQYPPCLAP